MEPQARQRLAGLMTDILMFYTVSRRLSSCAVSRHNYKGTAEEAWEAFQLALEALPPDFKASQSTTESSSMATSERTRPRWGRANIDPKQVLEIEIACRAVGDPVQRGVEVSFSGSEATLGLPEFKPLTQDSKSCHCRDARNNHGQIGDRASKVAQNSSPCDTNEAQEQ